MKRLAALLRRVLGASTEPNPLHTTILATLDRDEAEMDRYVKYHTSDQWGR